MNEYELNLKYMKMKICLIIVIFGFIGFTVHAQIQTPWRDVWAASGDFFFVQNQGSLSWTIGEDITETFGTSSPILTQGFQQSDDSTANIPESGFENQIIVYPNPGNDQINILFNTGDVSEVIIQLFDVTGRLILREKTSTLVSPYTININSVSSTFYYLIISKPDDKILYSKPIVKF